MSTQAEIIARLPRHLRPYACVQDYARYTARDHAVWRFIMRQLTRSLEHSAHPVYFEGLKKTGIRLDRIPSIDEMNRCLEPLGWSALVVDGYIPTSVFSEFQMRRILAIAMDMRSIDNILYTPAPDIVHESAGHAPFIVDVDYAEYLQRFGEISMKAISTQADHAVFLAIRALSALKEARNASDAELANAQAGLDAALAANDHSSEAARLARLQWWTIEYGLVGDVADYKLFGAGLLSSLGESRSCLDDGAVRKLPLTVEAVNTPYDITRPQPQLFVARSCQHLTQVLEVFAQGMCFRKGGAESLRVAIGSGSVCTARYNSGLEVGGVFDRALTDAIGNAIYLGTRGPTQLAFQGRELVGHGVETHAEGYGSPVGRLQGLPRCLSDYSVDELKSLGIAVGRNVRLDYLSGIRVQGRLDSLRRESGRNLIFSFSDCTVTGLAGERLFEPHWGRYDLGVGEAIVSVCGGPADRESLADTEAFDTTTREPAQHSPTDRQLDAIYADLRALRERGAPASSDLQPIENALQRFPGEWLARLELLELANADRAERLQRELAHLAQCDADKRPLIEMGLGGLSEATTRPAPSRTA
ncbi:aromatic amino acid hydroxylase [Hydrocarboniphaga effusa]|uniref:aromatic amino acid hydroxylase n=1 Tax=Hydrocarboniphaga effusa TaxID=243629 RepID=UPI00398BF9EF